MLLIYTPLITNRIKYVFELVFVQILGVEINITTNAQLFKQEKLAKLGYAEQPLDDELFFKSSSLLTENGIKTINNLPEDIFALIFFLVTRYEEYLPFNGDEHGRYYSKQSLLAKNDLLHKPLVNIKAAEIKKQIKDKYSQFIFPEKKFSCTPTIDIDNAYAFKGKGFLMNAGSLLKSFFNTNLQTILKQIPVLLNRATDPFDTYALQFRIHETYRLNPTYFFLLGDRSQYDKNLSHEKLKMRELVRTISSAYEIGIHPSYQSNSDISKIVKEKNRLEQIIGKKTVNSRQHFLMLKFPDTYRGLLNAGIISDYSMGYADDIGFRAGICTPFYWYDLEREEKTNLLIHPFCLMDGSLCHYLKLTPAQALEKAQQLIAEVKAVNGNFSFIWHNETFSDWREWKGWREVYEQILKMSA